MWPSLVASTIAAAGRLRRALPVLYADVEHELTADRWRAGTGLSVSPLMWSALAFGAWVGFLIGVVVFAANPPLAVQGFDVHNYWLAWSHGELYADRPMVYGVGAYLYSPLFAQIIWPLTRLPYEAFRLVLAIPAGLAFAWLFRPMPWPVRVPFMLLAVALVFVPRYPILWTFLLWTKIAPAIGIVSLVRQRRWRALLLLLNLSAVIALAAFVVAPHLMFEWIALVQDSGQLAVIRYGDYAIYPPMWLRLAAGAAIAYFGASRPWTLAVAATLVTPDLTTATVPLLAAAPRLATFRRPTAPTFRRR